MARRGADGLVLCRRPQRARVRASLATQARIEGLVRDFRRGEPLVPMFVLHAEESAGDERVNRILDDVHAVQADHGTRCAVLDPRAPGPEQPIGPGGDRVRAALLLQALDTPRAWGDSAWPRVPGVAYRRYRFPRLRLVHAIADAVREVDQQGEARVDPAAERRALAEQLARQRWRPRAAHRRNSLGERLSEAGTAGLLAAVLAVLTALLPLFEAPLAFSVACGFLMLLAVLYFVPVGRAPLLLWMRRESRWFLTTTFLLPVQGRQSYEAGLLHPFRSWRSVTDRAADVAGSLREGGNAQLQLHVLALLEDLRDAHRRWSGDLRGFKRLRPPVLFLRRADPHDGGIALLQAISDVRTVRSELDPLLVVASVDAADVAALDERRAPERAARRAPYDFADRLARLHEDWEGALRARQSPSSSGTVPWALRIAVPAAELEPPVQQVRWCERAAARPRAARVLWSAWAGTVVLGALAGLLISYQVGLADTYCRTGLLSADRDTGLLGRGKARECVGLSTGAVRFGAGLPPRKKGETPPWDLEDIEKLIAESNEKAGENAFTVVYAGPLSTADDSSSPVKGAEELAGVALAQDRFNADEGKTRMRVLVANGGVDMGHQTEMARRIVAYARRDPSVVGVVGLGRNMTDTGKAVGILREAQLPVVSGTNSSKDLPTRYRNWFSLAANDDWQARKLAVIAEQLADRVDTREGRVGERTTHTTVLLTRAEKGTRDQYAKDQAEAFARHLTTKDTGLDRPGPGLTYQVSNGKPAASVVDSACRAGDRRDPLVVLVAGRAEDLPPLTRRFGTVCAERAISVITGDDVSKAHFPSESLPANVTIYHSTLVDPWAWRDPTFYEEAQRFLPGVPEDIGPGDAALASGQTALAHDATWALAEAADRAEGRGPAETWVRLAKGEGTITKATGDIGFAGYPQAEGHGAQSMALWRVSRRAGDGRLESVLLCGIKAGPRDWTPHAGDCPIDKTAKQAERERGEG
ncbi:hypothetical protein ACQYWQ_06320 [Streptomyces sp. P6-2-1]|uniref:hypothetical protein n=1 Tax=unclassified Streptomyces TaxID=2593676 RepID=UPI003D361929